MSESEDMVHSTDETVDSSVRSPKQVDVLHTPTPWVVEDGTVIWNAIVDHPETSYDLGLPIAEMRTMKSIIGPAYSRAQVEANAARIVHCVNLHDELVEALSGFLDYKRFDVFIGGNPIVVEDFLDRARSVLKKARGEA